MKWFFFLNFAMGCHSPWRSQNTSKEKELVTSKKYEEEIQIGRQMAGQLLEAYGSYDDPHWLVYINQVGQLVGKYSQSPQRRYMFAILNTEEINGFACPGGYILITLGALKHAQSESELAMILAHEIAHVDHEHMLITLKSMMKKKSSFLTSSRHGRERIMPSSSSLGESVPQQAGELSGSKDLGVFVPEAVKNGMKIFLEKGIHHRLEYEADAFALIYVARAGYSPKGLEEFLKRLDKSKKELNLKLLDKTHPRLSSRYKKLEALRKSQKLSLGATGLKRFHKMKTRFHEVL